MEVEDPKDFSLGNFSGLTAKDAHDTFKGMTIAQRSTLNNALRKAPVHGGACQGDPSPWGAGARGLLQQR